MYSFFICAHWRLIFSFRGQRYTFFSLQQQLCRINFAIKLDFLCFWTFWAYLTLYPRIYKHSEGILRDFDNREKHFTKGKKDKMNQVLRKADKGHPEKCLCNALNYSALQSTVDYAVMDGRLPCNGRSIRR